MRVPRFSKDEMEVTLKGVQLTLRDVRDKRDLCQRNRLAGRKWMFGFKEISLALTKKSGMMANKEASDPTTAVTIVSAAKKKAPVHTVHPGVTSLLMQDRILANLRVKAGVSQQLHVSTSTSAGRVSEADSEEEELD